MHKRVTIQIYLLNLCVCVCIAGMVTIAHSGGHSVVGNSRVEEHLGREARSAVFDLQQYSQEPANYASNKLEVHVYIGHF